MNEPEETAAAIESIISSQAGMVDDLEALKAEADVDLLALESIQKRQLEIIHDLEALKNE